MSSGGCIIFDDADVVAIIATGLFCSLALNNKNGQISYLVIHIDFVTKILIECVLAKSTLYLLAISWKGRFK